MEWWHALVLGIVEGLTEYLPVSSTGHLLLTQRWLEIEQSDASDAFAICIQLGAILAVLGLYRQRVFQMANGVLGRDPAGRRLALNIAVAFIPAAVAGLFLERPIKHFLFGPAWGLWPIVLAWFVGGAAILGVSYFRKNRVEKGRRGFTIDDLTWRHALIIGVIQCVAMWPGTSRSLVTIVGGILVGLAMASAVEFSFLLGVMTLGAATAYDGMRHGPAMIENYGVGFILLGLVGAWVSAVLAVRWMVSYLNRHGLNIFGYYRIALAIVVALLIWNGVITQTLEFEPVPASVEDAQLP